MARPERRKSSLATASPIRAAVPAPYVVVDRANEEPNEISSSTATTETVATTVPVTPAEADEHEESAAPARPIKKRGPVEDAKKTRIGPYVLPDEADRIRSAYLNGWTREHQGSFTDFLKHAIVRYVEELEAKHNDGTPWPTVGGNAVKSVAQMNVEAAKRQKGNR